MAKSTKETIRSDTTLIDKAGRILKTGIPTKLGVRVTSMTKKKVIAEMPIKRFHLNRSGYVNGGAIMAFADALGAAGTIANLRAGYQTSTLESKSNFFAGGKGPVLTATAVPLHIGHTTMVWQTTVRNPDRRAVAVITQTQIVIPTVTDKPVRVARPK